MKNSRRDIAVEISRISDTILPSPDKASEEAPLCVEGFEFREYLESRIRGNFRCTRIANCCTSLQFDDSPNLHDFIKVNAKFGRNCLRESWPRRVEFFRDLNFKGGLVRGCKIFYAILLALCECPAISPERGE